MNELGRAKHASLSITADEARAFLERLASKKPADLEWRTGLEANTKGVLKDYKIDVTGDIPDSVTLPSPDAVRRFIDETEETDYLGRPGKDVLGWAILYIVLGAMPFVAGDAREGDAAG
jgi:hypothetical protein